MPFFVFNISNHREQYSDFNIKFFNSEVEKDDFINSNLEKSEKVYFLKSETLLDIITNKTFETHENCATTDDVVDIYTQFIIEFGTDLIKKEFPNEDVGREFIHGVIKECDKIQNDMMEEVYETMDQQDYSNKKADWEISYDDETSKWDDETDGSWRIENDFG